MKPLLLNLFLGLTWVGLTGDFNRNNFILGLFLSYGVLYLFQGTLGTTSYFKKVRQVTYFIIYFAWQLILANLRVAYEVLTPDLRMSPAIIAIPLDVKSGLEITLLANLITLTPGTLSLEVSEDNRFLYVHTMYFDEREAFVRSIKEGFEKRVQELFQ